MKKNKYHIQIALLLLSVTAFTGKQTEPWKAEQLLSPARLDSVINSASKDKPLIICIGPSALIKGSLDAGAAKEKENLARLRQLLSKEKKDREVVIYCGCCPFDRCPNIRPAFQLLNEMKFIHAKLLNLPKNLKADWIDHGYSINQ